MSNKIPQSLIDQRRDIICRANAQGFKINFKGTILDAELIGAMQEFPTAVAMRGAMPLYCQISWASASRIADGEQNTVVY